MKCTILAIKLRIWTVFYLRNYFNVNIKAFEREFLGSTHFWSKVMSSYALLLLCPPPTLVFFGTWPCCKVLLWYHVHLWLLHDLFFPLADNTSLEDHLHFFTSHSLTSFLLTLIFGTPMQTVFNQVMSAFYFNIFGVPFPLFNYLSGSYCGQFYLPFSFSGDESQCLKTFLVVKTGGVCCK